MLLFSSLQRTSHIPIEMLMLDTLTYLINQLWQKPSSIPLISCMVKNFYRVQQDKAKLLFKHPIPNSIIVQTAQMRSKSSSCDTPNNRESHKLDLLVHKVYSSRDTSHVHSELSGHDWCLPSIHLGEIPNHHCCLTTRQEAPSYFFSIGGILFGWIRHPFHLPHD